MKVVAIGADISSNDVSVSDSLVKNIEKDIPKLLELGARKAALTNVTGDDVVITAFVEDNLLETVNAGIVEILRNNAEDLGDVAGISEDPNKGGEGVSYAEANLEDGEYQDAIIMAFDTYGGEPFVADVANSVIEAASGMKAVTGVSDRIGERTDIPGVGYVSPDDTDDPVVVVSVNERHTSCNVLPGSVLVSVTALMNGNMIDLSIPFENKTRILG